MPEIPETLLDPIVLSQNIYEYWISLLRTDNLVDSAAAGWSELEASFQEDFTEAVRVKVTDILDAYADEVRLDERINKSFQEAAGNSQCYACGINPVISPGDICGRCSSSHIVRNQ